MSTITLPLKLDLKSWVYCLIDDLPEFSVPLPTEEEQWEQWVESLIYNNDGNDIPLPKIASMTNEEGWREWASYFVVTTKSLS